MKEKTKINLIGIYLFLFLVSLVIIGILSYVALSNNLLIMSIMIISCSGGIGGTIYSIRGFYQHLGDNDFKFNWTWWYVFRPIISIVIGVFVYFFIVGGLISIGSISNVSYSKGLMFYSAIAFLAGFSFTQFANKLEELAKILFTKSEAKK